MTQSIPLPLRALRALLPFIGTDDTRLPLTGLAIELHREGTRLVATDGRRLVVYTCPRAPSFPEPPDPSPEPILVPGRLIAALDALVRTVADLVRTAADPDIKDIQWDIDLIVADGVAEFTFDGITLRAPLISERPPNWRKALPNPLPDAFATGDAILHSEFLASMSRLLSDLGIEGGVTVTRADSIGPLIYRTANQPGGQSLLAALMPMRIQPPLPPL